MFDCIERIISVPTAFTAWAVPISLETCARPWLPIGGTMIGNGKRWPRMVVVRSGFSTPRKEMRLDRNALHRAQVFALGVLGAGAAEYVTVAALWQDLLSFDLKLGEVDDAQALHLGAAGILDGLIARLRGAAASFAGAG